MPGLVLFDKDWCFDQWKFVVQILNKPVEPVDQPPCRDSCATMSFGLHDAVMVTSDISTHDTFLATHNVAGKTFFVVRKSDRKLHRLFLGDAFKGLRAERPLARTTIIDQIREARDAAIWSRLGGKKGGRLSKDHKATMLILEDTFADMAVMGYSLRMVCKLFR